MQSQSEKNGLLSITNHLPSTWRHRTVGEVHRCLTTHRTLCYDSACSLAETSHLFHSQTETTKQTTLHNMLDSDGSVHLETNGQTFISSSIPLAALHEHTSTTMGWIEVAVV
jgi:hypothetical protein